MSSKTPLSFLSEYKIEKKFFQNLDSLFELFKKEPVCLMHHFQKTDYINRELVKLLKEHQERKFLLIEVLDYIDRIHKENILEKYSLSDFELWMNQFSGMSGQENTFYRALIVGKSIPRDDYQVFFPIGMGKVHQGSHFVTAHQSPDIDTIVSSFWGWMDAFSARVGSGLHVWNVPGGPPESSVEVNLLFHQMLHPDVFAYLSKNRAQLAITSFDLMSQQGFVKKRAFEDSLRLEAERTESGVVLVDDEGYYVGDWRPFDVESIRQVIMLLNLCMRWYETAIHRSLFGLFTKKDLDREDVIIFEKEIKTLKVSQADPLKEMTLRQHTLLGKFLSEVLLAQEGLEVSYYKLLTLLEENDIINFSSFWRHLEKLENSDLFDRSGSIQENRPLIFEYLQKMVLDLEEVFRNLRQYLDTLDIGYQIKTKVFGYQPQYLSYRTDFGEIENQMGSYPYLTVNVAASSDKLLPVGIIKAKDIKKPYLGTATLRDFCNREETKVPPYLEVISVIDHHKSSLSTNSAPTATIADAQSANTIVSQLAISVHDEYSLSGMSEEDVRNQIEDLAPKAKSKSDYRILQRLYKKQEILKSNLQFYIDPKREYLEYLHYLYAILDDTDLLTKVSARDVIAVAEIMNRLKTISEKKEVETTNFDDISRDSDFVKNGAKKLLKNKDLYSLYSLISNEKEKVIGDNFIKCSEGKTSDIFTDTKVQNGCCRVGQTKIFNQNYPLFEKLREQIRSTWHESSKLYYKDQKDVDLYMHMISTIASAKELHEGELINYSHKDEMWIWIPKTDLAVEHFKLFLNNFKACPAMTTDAVKITCYGTSGREYATLFKESFIKAPIEIKDEKNEQSYAVIFYKAGALNSRKAMVSPFLPKIAK